MEQSPLYAAVDLGSNSFHLLIVRKVAGQVRIVSRVKRKVRLASGLDSNNNLSSDAMKRGLDCIRLFAEQLQDVAAENIRIVGTATLRLAANRDYFVEQAERILKHRVEVISGKREASLIYLGVSVTSSGTGSRLVIDIGGASTEIVLGHGYDVSVVNSLPMGCVLWQSRFFGDGIVDSDRFSRAVGAAEEIVRTVAEQYKGYSWELCSGASGTIQALQEIIIAGGGVSEEITLDLLMKLTDRCIKAGSISNIDIPGLVPERRQVFPSGLSILTALFRVLGIRSMILSGGALREGLIAEMVGFEQRVDARVRTVRSLIERYQLDSAQSERVRSVALSIYDAVKDEWKFGPPAGRAMLKWAAVLYEIGLCIEYKRAPQHAWYIINNIDMPGFTIPQKQLLSALLYNERDGFHLDVLAKQSAVPFSEACRLARILRISIIMCMRRSDGTLPDIKARASGDSLDIRLPGSWLSEHYLRSTELQHEAELQTSMGWPTVICDDQQGSVPAL